MCWYSVFGTTVSAGILLNTELLYVCAGLTYLYVCAGIVFVFVFVCVRIWSPYLYVCGGIGMYLYVVCSCWSPVVVCMCGYCICM